MLQHLTGYMSGNGHVPEVMKPKFQPGTLAGISPRGAPSFGWARGIGKGGAESALVEREDIMLRTAIGKCSPQPASTLTAALFRGMTRPVPASVFDFLTASRHHSPNLQKGAGGYARTDSSNCYTGSQIYCMV